MDFSVKMLIFIVNFNEWFKGAISEFAKSPSLI